jgi:hypothetical protein
MKRQLGSFAAAVVLSVLLAIPLAYARGGGGGGGFGGGGHGGGGFGGGGWHGGGRGFYGRGWGWHHRGYGYGFGGYFWGDPFWWGYPYWWWPGDYYGYYGYPSAYDYGYPPYDYYGYEEPPAYQYGNPPSVYPENPASVYPEYDGRDYLKLGHDSGKALRLKAVTYEWLVDYIRAYIINAPLSARDDFRRGFISGYGEDGKSVLKKAVEGARRPIPPPHEAVPPPTSGSSNAAKQP